MGDEGLGIKSETRRTALAELPETEPKPPKKEIESTPEKVNPWTEN